MVELPPSEIYEQELEFMPYKKSLKSVRKIIEEKVQKNGKLVDLMCGPGYLLGRIKQDRPDLKLLGMDEKKNYISYAKQKYGEIDFEVGDIFSWKSSKEPFDAAICTGALHNIPYKKQEEVIQRMASMIKPEGFCLISDCYVDNFSNETERKIAATKLGYEYLTETIKNGAPDNVIEKLVEILHNDVMKKEFKTSIEKRNQIFKRNFKKIKTIKIWPMHLSDYGDYITILEQCTPF